MSLVIYNRFGMDKKREAWFYRKKSGREPAREWLNSLKDRVGLEKIRTRIRMAETGNFGDRKGVGEGVNEMRISYGPGYRLYYGLDIGGNLIILLVGGKKSSQTRDIEKAKVYWEDYKKRRISL